jgi:hypothetical protein
VTKLRKNENLLADDGERVEGANFRAALTQVAGSMVDLGNGLYHPATLFDDRLQEKRRIGCLYVAVQEQGCVGCAVLPG